MSPSRHAEAATTYQRLADECQRLQSLLNGLLDPKQPPGRTIHEIRKLCKVLRGGIALFDLPRPAGRHIQAIGRLLGSPRDAVVRLQTWQGMAWHDDELAAAAISAWLEHQVTLADTPTPAPCIHWCLRHAHSAHQGLLSLDLDQHTSSVMHGLDILRRKTIKRCGKLDHGSARAFHHARKALKAWLGAQGLISGGPPAAHLKDLADSLGNENDLATLSEWLEGHGFGPRTVPTLWEQLSAGRHHFQRRAMDLAGKGAASLSH